MREKPDNLYEAIAARGEGAAGAHPETPSSFVRDNPHEKTVCKRFATVFVSFDALQHLRIFEPKPRFNFAALVLSLPLAAGALSNLRKSLCDKRTETKKPLSSYLEAVFPFVPAPAALSQFRAETEIWTRDPFITSEVLYRWAIFVNNSKSVLYWHYVVFPYSLWEVYGKFCHHLQVNKMCYKFLNFTMLSFRLPIVQCKVYFHKCIIF